MTVTTRRRAAAIAANLRAHGPSSSKRRRNSQTPPAPIKTNTQDPKRHKNGRIMGISRRRKSLPSPETRELAYHHEHRLYPGAAVIYPGEGENDYSPKFPATISPRLKSLLNASVEHQAGFYERKLAQMSADLAATGEWELWNVHHALDVALVMLRSISTR